MQKNRLFKIIYFLLENGKTTAPELAEYLEVSVRTIYRDIDVLSSAGIPVYALPGKSGGITLLDGFTLDRSLLSSDEQGQILTGLQALNSIEQHNEKSLLTKLGSYFTSASSSWIEVDLSNWRKSRHIQNNFNLIKSAIFDRHMICFQYFGTKGQTSDRCVEPQKLMFKGQDWYLYGFCRQKSDYRLFKLSRIKDLSLSDEFFSSHVPQASQITSTNVQPTSAEPACISVLLKFDASVSYRVYDEFDEDCITPLDDCLSVKTELPGNPNMLLNYLFSYGSHVEIIEPAHIRRLILNEVQKMNQIYKICKNSQNKKYL